MKEHSNLQNLTGHPITFIDKDNKVIDRIYPSVIEEPLRATVEYSRLKEVNGIPTSLLSYNVDATQNTLNRLQNSYDGIIVSKITAEGLRKRGYKGTVYITGRKHYNFETRELLGVRELSLFNLGSNY